MPAPVRKSERIAFGDWQTPPELAQRIVERVATHGTRFATVLEPTCGDGEFLLAAGRQWPTARLVGFDVSAPHIARAREQLGDRARLEVGDCFSTDWRAVVGELPGPLLILGNPPWVTTAGLGVVDGDNRPLRSNETGARGIDAATGKSNFDVSEWLLLRLLEATEGQRATMAMLAKASVALRLLGHAERRTWDLAGELRSIDARRWFGAAVDAVLMITREGGDRRWPCYPSLDAKDPIRTAGIVGGALVADLERSQSTRDLAGASSLTWRSGIKHDCARVVELRRTARGRWINGFGERVAIESDYRFPLLKGSDLANRRPPGERELIVTQRSLGADTSPIRERAPATWRYLQAHREHFEARKSSIHRGQPEFSMFGIGGYAFAEFKLAIAGLYERVEFSLLGHHEARPIMLDDTCYFLPCERREQAERIHAVLGSERVREFLAARVQCGAKRPITKAILASLALDATG